MKCRLNYHHTLKACLFSNFFQAIGCVFPMLLIPLRNQCGLTYTQFGILVSLNFMTQVTSDVLFSKLVDWYGFRRFAVAAPVFTSLGLLVFAQAPLLFPDHTFLGFCLGMMLFAGAAGLQELLLSPIVDALPIDGGGGKNMSILHAFYPWGQIFVIISTTAMLFFFGEEKWQLILRCWAVMPLISTVLFWLVPLKNKTSGEGSTGVRMLLKSKLFWMVAAAIIFGGAAEVTMGQWVSAFIERGLRLPKTIGDTVGMCGFALTLAIGRTVYGIKGSKIPIQKVMIGGSFAAAVLYLTAALTAYPLIGLLACGLTGICVSMLWPGSIVLGSRNFPLAGASMFALLSAFGDVGASAGAYAVGRIVDSVTESVPGILIGSSLSPEQLGLRTGMLIAALFPFACCIVNIVLAGKGTKE